MSLRVQRVWNAVADEFSRRAYMPDVALSGAVSRYAADDAEFQLFVLLQSPSVRLCIERVCPWIL